MNSKIALRVAFMAILVIFMDGCCSIELIGSSNKTVVDGFYPTAVYQSTNGSCIALEGTLHLNRSSKAGINYRPPAGPSYLLVSEVYSGHQPFPADTSLALDRIQKFPRDFAVHSKLRQQLPSSYKKIVDLSKYPWRIEARIHHPNRAVLAFLPFTVAADAATSPFQIFAFGMLILMSHNGGC